MSLVTLEGFFSYAHKDDVRGQLSNLRVDLIREFECLTGRTLDLFFDRDSLMWGERWEEAINESIFTSTVFIPVLTPKYFQSENCLTELRVFLSKTEQSGASELILPIHYIDITADYLSLDSDLVSKVLRYQYMDWTDLRFKPRKSEKYKRAINEMALRLIQAQSGISDKLERELHAETGSDSESTSDEQTTNSETEEAGFLDEALEIIESQSQEFTACLESLTSDIIAIGNILNEGSKEIEKTSASPQSAKQITTITIRIAKKLEPVVDRYERDSKHCSQIVSLLDPAVRTYIQVVGEGDKSGSGNTKQLDSIIEMSKSATSAKAQIDSFAEAARANKRISRALYKPFQIIEQATISCGSSFTIVIDWGVLARSVTDNDSLAV